MSVLACDLGGTRIKIGIVAACQVIASEVIPARADQGLSKALDRVEEGFRSLAVRAETPWESCRGIGLGFPALVDFRTGKLLNSYGKFTDGPSVDAVAWGRQRFGLPAVVENDARLALLGEQSCGAAQDCRNVAIVTLGTGIGSAVILEGTLLRGPHAQAGNLCGHMIVRVGGEPCICGARGCVEAETGSAGLARRARRLASFSDSALATEAAITYSAVCRLAIAGDEAARQLLHDACDAWGAMCVNMIQAFDLERIVLGGGVMASADAILPRLREYIHANTSAPWGEPAIEVARNPDLMGLLGCEPLLTEFLSR